MKYVFGLSISSRTNVTNQLLLMKLKNNGPIIRRKPHTPHCHCERM